MADIRELLPYGGASLKGAHYSPQEAAPRFDGKVVGRRESIPYLPPFSGLRCGPEPPS